MPIDAEALNDAISDLKSTPYVDGLEDKIASEYDLKSALLLRMFEKKYGKHPRDFRVVDNSDLYRDNAIKKAKEAVKKFSAGEASEQFAGIVFERNGEEYVCIGVAKDGIKAIRVADTKQWTIHFANVAEMSRFVYSKIRKF